MNLASTLPAGILDDDMDECTLDEHRGLLIFPISPALSMRPLQLSSAVDADDGLFDCNGLDAPGLGLALSNLPLLLSINRLRALVAGASLGFFPTSTLRYSLEAPPTCFGMLSCVKSTGTAEAMSK